MTEEGRDLPPRPPVLGSTLRLGRVEPGADPPGNGLPADGLPADGLPADGLPADGLPADGLPEGDLPEGDLSSNGLSGTDLSGTGLSGADAPAADPASVPGSWSAFEPAPGPWGEAEPRQLPPAARGSGSLPRRVPKRVARPRAFPAPGTRWVVQPVRLPRAVPDLDGRIRGAFEPACEAGAVHGPDTRDRDTAEPTRGPTIIPDPAAVNPEASPDTRPAPAPTPQVTQLPQGATKSAAKAGPSWAAVPATTARRWARRRASGSSTAARRRRRVPVLIALALVLAASGYLIFALSGHDQTRPADPPPGAADGLGAAAVTAAVAVRYQAAGWAARQLNRDATVACDPVMCAALHSRGFPAANLVPILPARPDPLGAELVVATAAVRNQFGARLASVYAPQVIASFGTGQARIEIRTILPDGAAAFRSRLGSDERAAVKQGAQVLGNRQITVSQQASAALKDGHVDGRLTATLAALAAQHPVHVIAFGDASPGAGPGIPLRSAVLAGVDGAARLRATAYLHWLLGFLHAQRSEYRATSVTVGQLAGSGTVVRIEFAAPST